MWLIVNFVPLTLGPRSGGVRILTEIATPQRTSRITPIAIVMPFQFLSLVVAPTSSCKIKLISIHITFCDCCKQSLNRLYRPPIHPSTHPPIHPAPDFLIAVSNPWLLIKAHFIFCANFLQTLELISTANFLSHSNFILTYFHILKQPNFLYFPIHLNPIIYFIL